jgi:ribosomal protein S18
MFTKAFTNIQAATDAIKDMNLSDLEWLHAQIGEKLKVEKDKTTRENLRNQRMLKASSDPKMKGR